MSGLRAVELVSAYAREADPLHRRGDRGPEQLPSGAAILALDDEGRARAVVAAYELLPDKSGQYGRTIMLGLLLTTLVRKNLPLRVADYETMAAHAARAWGPAWGPCDYDAALVKALKRCPRISPKVKVALRLLVKRRGTQHAIDRRIAAACEELCNR